MKKIVLLAVLAGVSGCVTPSPEEIAELNKKYQEEARITTENRLREEQELNNYIANKSEVICKSQGFKSGTKDLAQCASVAATEMRMQIAYQNQLAEKQKRQEKNNIFDSILNNPQYQMGMAQLSGEDPQYAYRRAIRNQRLKQDPSYFDQYQREELMDRQTKALEEVAESNKSKLPGFTCHHYGSFSTCN